jgi:pimeloyl-ACP methyl ester carboxylesterase
MGTMVAQHLAVRRPDLVAGLVLSAPLCIVDDPFREVLDRWAGLVREHRWVEFAADAAACSYTGDEGTRHTDLAERSSAAQPDHLRARHLALTDLCRRHEPPAPLSAIAAPTLLLAADADPVAPPHHARRLASALPDARLHVLPGLAHGFPEQAASAFSTFVTTFFGEVAAVSAAWGMPTEA